MPLLLAVLIAFLTLAAGDVFAQARKATPPERCAQV